MKSPARSVATLREYYEALRAAYGPQQWWPAQTPFEVVIGAYLTQNTAWRNVERSIANLRDAGALHIDGLRTMPIHLLQAAIRPSGYMTRKSAALKAFVAFLDAHHSGSLAVLAACPTAAVREALLSLPGIGPETADAILLYALGHPVMVGDEYLRRVLTRHRLLPLDARYPALKTLGEQVFADDPPAERLGHLNEFHALIVQVGKTHCRGIPRCAGCPLAQFLPRNGPQLPPTPGAPSSRSKGGPPPLIPTPGAPSLRSKGGPPPQIPTTGAPSLRSKGGPPPQIPTPGAPSLRSKGGPPPIRKTASHPMKLYVATGNPGKLRDFAAAADALGPANAFTIAPLPGLPAISAPAEDGATFGDNARTKALYYATHAPGEIVLSDDSGLEVDALDGAPGVWSARYARSAIQPGEPAPATAADPDTANNTHLLHTLAQHASRRPFTARYRCVIAAARDGHILACGEGTVEGYILTNPRGAGGFGYDPLFLLPDLGLTMAEIDQETRLRISHRGAALRQLLLKLERLA